MSSQLPTVCSALTDDPWTPAISRLYGTIYEENFFFYVQIRIGEHETEMNIPVVGYDNHEEYNSPSTLNNDITIIELAWHVNLYTYTPACVAKSSDTNTFDWKYASVYGEMTD